MLCHPLHPHGINPVFQAAGRIERDVCCGITEFAAPLRAVNHQADHLESITEHAVGAFKLALCQSGPDGARGDDLAAFIAERRHETGCKSVSLARFGEVIRCSASIFSEMKVLAHHHAGSLEAIDQHIAHEIRGAHIGEVGIECEFRQPVKSDRGQPFRAQGRGCELEKRGFGPEKPARMRRETERPNQHFAALREVPGLAHNCRMAPVRAVEIPDADDRIGASNRCILTKVFATQCQKFEGFWVRFSHVWQAQSKLGAHPA